MTLLKPKGKVKVLPVNRRPMNMRAIIFHQIKWETTGQGVTKVVSNSWELLDFAVQFLSKNSNYRSTCRCISTKR